MLYLITAALAIGLAFALKRCRDHHVGDADYVADTLRKSLSKDVEVISVTGTLPE